ncbi:hypothetical protein ACFL3T_04515 [Patescibacteria group bacterium]
MKSLNEMLDEVAETFTKPLSVTAEGCVNDVFPEEGKVAIPAKWLNDEDVLSGIKSDLGMFSKEEIRRFIETGKSPFQIIRDFVSEKIAALSETVQLKVLEGVLSSQTHDPSDLANFISAEVEAVLHPENF